MVKEGYKEVRLGAKQIEVPKSWYVEFLGNIANFKQGTQVPVDEQKYKKTEGYVRFLRIVDYTQNTDDVRYIEHPGKKYIVDKDEIIMVRYGEAGLVCRGFNGVIANNLFKIDINTDLLDKTFSYFFLKQDKVYNYLSSLRLTSAMPAINFGIVSNLKILIPSLSEQKKIASILSSVDKSIEKTDEVIEETKELKKGLMKELLTKGIGHSEFKELKFGPEIISLPLDWKILKLKEITDVRSSNVNKKSKNNERHIKLCNYTDVYYNEQINENIKFMEATAKDREIERFTLEKDDVIITKDSETPDDIGVPAVVTKDLSNILCGYHLALLKPNKKLIDGEFLSKMLQSKNITNQFYRLAQGLTRFGLRVTSIKNTKIPVPPLEEQKKIASILSSADAKIQKEEEYKSKLERLKKGLMQKLLTGEIRVNTEMEV